MSESAAFADQVFEINLDRIKKYLKAAIEVDPRIAGDLHGAVTGAIDEAKKPVATPVELLNDGLMSDLVIEVEGHGRFSYEAFKVMDISMSLHEVEPSGEVGKKELNVQYDSEGDFSSVGYFVEAQVGGENRLIAVELAPGWAVEEAF